MSESLTPEMLDGIESLARALAPTHPAEVAVILALVAAAAERDGLASAIRAHRSQRADDRCIEDDDRLYAALGDGIACDRDVGDKAAMLRNCARFIDRRCEAGKWPSYADLEAERDSLRSIVEAARGSHADLICAFKEACWAHGPGSQKADDARASLEVAIDSLRSQVEGLQAERDEARTLVGAQETHIAGLQAERRVLCRACSDDRDNGDMHCPSCGCDL